MRSDHEDRAATARQASSGLDAHACMLSKRLTLLLPERLLDKRTVLHIGTALPHACAGAMLHGGRQFSMTAQSAFDNAGAMPLCSTTQTIRIPPDPEPYDHIGSESTWTQLAH